MAHSPTLFSVFLVFLVSSTYGDDSVIVEKGGSASVKFELNSNVQDVKCSVKRSSSYIEISNCSFGTTPPTCNNKQPATYQATISSGSNKMIVVNISGAKTSETTFLCEADTGQEVTVTIEVYAWPTKPVCEYIVEDTYVEYRCKIDNGFPMEIIYTPKRAEEPISSSDFDPSYKSCMDDEYGSGTDGDYAFMCSFRIPLKNMLPTTTFTLGVKPHLSSYANITKTEAVSDPVYTKFIIPEIGVRVSKCPEGPGVDSYKETILIGTEATCKCEMKELGFPPGFARWYLDNGDIYGFENVTDGSSTLTISYNSTEVDKTYQCRAVIAFRQNVTYRVPYIPIFHTPHVIIEKRQSTSFQCSFPKLAKSITWRLLNNWYNDSVVLTTCNSGDNTCSDKMPTIYQGSISSSGDNIISSMKVTSVKINETDFTCGSDVGPTVYHELEPYAWPTKLACSQAIGKDYVIYTCSSGNVYSGFSLYMNRRESELTEADENAIDGDCEQGPLGSGTDGDYNASCSLKVPMKILLPNNTFYMTMSARTKRGTKINRTATVGDDMITTLKVPEVRVQTMNCPVGPGVSTMKYSILIGTEATCKCEMRELGFPPGYARWYNQDGDIVGLENDTDSSSTITISYNSSEPGRRYRCKPVIQFNANVAYVDYEPTFYTPTVIIEKRQSTSIQSSFASTTKSVTWKLVASDYVTVSTCNAVDKTCNDQMPSLYQGSISMSGNNIISSLKVTSVKVNDTYFICESDVGPTIIHELEPYAWPTKLACSQAIGMDYVNYTCSTGNVYWGFYVDMYRRESELTAADWKIIGVNCKLGPRGSGSDGDYNASCSFQVPMEILLPNNTFYMTMMARVYSDTEINRTATVGDDMITTLTIPKVVVDKTKCPVGPGVQGDSILIETAATCKCEMSTSGFPPGFARWFTQDNKTVGVENATDMSSTLTIMYNSAEPIQVFECRPIASFKVNTTAVTYTAVFTSIPVLVEKGQTKSLQCSFPITVSSIKWQLLSGSSAVSLSTCSFVSNTCSDNMPASYRGSIVSSATNRVMGLTITSAGINETKFFCVADNQLKSYVSKLEVYAWPTKPRCGQILTKSYVEYNCTTDNVYPGINAAVLHRREMEFTQNDFTPLNTTCSNGNYGSGTNGDMMATCKWRIPIDKVLANNSVFVAMTAQVSNMTMVSRSAAVSDDVATTIIIPEVAVNMQNCPVGPGVQGDSIFIGTVATCKCEMKANGFPPGFARWFTQDMRMVGVENATDMSSTLTVSYNASEPFQMYQCGPIIPFKAIGKAVSYIPLFRAAPVPAEKGQLANLQCSFPNTVTEITWQMLLETGTMNLSTCSFVNNTCTDLIPESYAGSMSSSGNIRTMGLRVASVSIKDVKCSCVANNGMRFLISQRQIYAWPAKPTCVQNITKTYVDYNCTTSNVYPGINPMLHRRMPDFSQSDFDLVNKSCTIGYYGSGTDGDFLASCLWRIPMKIMLARSSVFVEMTANIATLSMVNRSASVSDDITTTLTIPTVVVPRSNCPVGPGVRGNTILIETEATCKCQMGTLGFPPGFARWFTQDNKIVGSENATDMSSTLTIMYNSSEPIKMYKCWPIIPFKESGTAMSFTAFFTTTPVAVEKGHSANLQCSFPITVSSIKWQLVSEAPAVDLSSCSFVSNTCSDNMLASYRGSIVSSATNRVMGLTITSAGISETMFICVADNQLKSTISKLEVYAWPTKPSCVQNLTSTYIDYTCTTGNVYPGVKAVLNRRELNFTQSDFDPLNTFCLNGNYGSGMEGDMMATCKWRVPIDKVLANNSVFVAMTAQIYDMSMVNRSAAVSDDITKNLIVPEVAVNMQNCPVGPGVQGDSILIGTVATCKCEMKANGFPPGFARWFTQDMRMVGAENATDMSSTLTVSYNASEPFQMYQCWPIIPFKATGTPVPYTPLFRTAPVPVEKEEPAFLQCSFPNTVTEITWQMLLETGTVNLSTCSFVNNTCIDLIPESYAGSMSSSGNIRTMGLRVASVSIKDVKCSCVANNGMRFLISQREIYAWPITPTCVQNITDTYVEYNCTTNNVYPGINTILHRRGLDFSPSDFDRLNGNCNVGYYGSGTDGDFVVWCLWRIPMKNMLASSSVFVEVTPNVTTLPMINRKASFSQDITTTLTIPTVVVNKANCPVGPGVQGDSILIDTAATCKCEMGTVGFPPGFARWFTQDMKMVGVENMVDRSSTLTIVYNSSEPVKMYECWPVISFKANGTAVNYTAVFTTTPVLVEKGHSASLQCSFPITVSSIKWQLMSGGPAVSVSTCSFVTNVCSNLDIHSYKGFIISSGSNRVMGLNITRAGVNETKFICLADNKLKSSIFKLEVYVWPTKPICVQNVTNTFMEYNCTTGNVYPGINAVLHRRELDFTQNDFDPLNTTCSNGNYGSGTNGDMMATCKWRIPIDKVLQKSSVFVETTAQVSNLAMVNRSAAVSDDVTTTLTIPEVVVNKNYCPLGSGVRNGSVLAGTLATCKCEMKSNGIPSGFARWFTTEGMNVVGVENMDDKSSTLYFSSNYSVSSQGYECWPIVPFKASTTKVVYIPTFISASSSITGLQTMVIILVALTSWAVSDFS